MPIFLAGAPNSGGPVGQDLGTFGATASIALTDAPKLAYATLTASTTTALTVTGLANNRTATLRLTQPAGGGALLTVNGTSVTLNGAASSLTVINIYTDGTNVDVVSSASSSGGAAGTFLPWVSGATYVAGQGVTNSGRTYLAVSGHTATGSFQTDLGNNLWQSLPGTARYARTLTVKGSPLTVATNVDYITVPVAAKILGISADSDGTDVLVDVNAAGTTLFTTQASRPAPSGANNYFAPERVPDVVNVAGGTKLTLDVDQVGSAGGVFIGGGTYFSVSSSATSIALALPAAVVSGQLLVAGIIMSAVAAGSTITPPTGWALADDGTTQAVREYAGGASNNYSARIFWRIADGTEGSTATFTVSGGTPVTKLGQVFSYSSPNSTPVDKVAVATSSFGTTHAAPAVTPTSAGDLRISLYAFLSGASVTAGPSGGTQRGTLRMYDRILGSSGVSSGTDVVTTSGSSIAAMSVATFKTVTTTAPSNTTVKVNIRMEES